MQPGGASSMKYHTEPDRVPIYFLYYIYGWSGVRAGCARSKSEPVSILKTLFSKPRDQNAKHILRVNDKSTSIVFGKTQVTSLKLLVVLNEILVQ